MRFFSDVPVKEFYVVMHSPLAPSYLQGPKHYPAYFTSEYFDMVARRLSHHLHATYLTLSEARGAARDTSTLIFVLRLQNHTCVSFEGYKKNHAYLGKVTPDDIEGAYLSGVPQVSSHVSNPQWQVKGFTSGLLIPQ